MAGYPQMTMSFISYVSNQLEIQKLTEYFQSYQLCDGVKDSVGNTSIKVHSITCEINLEEPIQSANQANTVNRSSD